MSTTKSHSEQQAEAQIKSILDMLAECRAAEAKNDDTAREEAQQAIYDDPLSIEVRSGWVTPGSEMEPAEYMILLCTGGPAVRIIGELNGGQPDSARLEHQDWGTPWTEYRLNGEQASALLDYAQMLVSI